MIYSVKKIGVRAFVISSLLVLAYSCAVGPNLNRDEYDQAPRVFLNDTLPNDSTDVLEWWALFNDPVLDSLIKMAIDSNKNLLIAAQRVEQARLRANITRAEFGPKFNVQSQAIRGNYFGLPGGSLTDNFFAGATMSWELDFWGKIRRLNQNAKAIYLASEYGQRALQISLITEVASQYFTLLEFRKSLEIAQQTLELRLQTLEIIQARFDKGTIPEIDLNQSQIQFAIAEAAVPFYRQAVLQSELSIRVLLGQAPGPVNTGLSLEDIELEDEMPPGIPAQLLANRPDIQQAWYEAVAQNALIGAAQANRLPSISLTGTLGLAANDFSNFDPVFPAWYAGASLLGPLFYWNQNLRQVQIERAETEAVLQAYQNQVLISLAEVEGALIDIQANEDIINSTANRTDAALNALMLSDERYKRGVTSYLEYLNSQSEAFDAQLSLANSQADLLRSYINLYRALGGGWISEEEKESQD